MKNRNSGLMLLILVPKTATGSDAISTGAKNRDRALMLLIQVPKTSIAV